MARGPVSMPMPGNGVARAVAPKRHGMKHGGKRKLRRISIEPTMNGGFVAEHQFHDQGSEYQPPEQHAFSNAEDLHQHLQQHIPVQAPAAEEEAEGEA